MENDLQNSRRTFLVDGHAVRVVECPKHIHADDESSPAALHWSERGGIF